MDDANTALVMATARKAYLGRRANELKDQLLELWGRPVDTPTLLAQTDPTLLIVESHQTILACVAAVQDFPRAQEFLQQNLDKAKRVLVEFERRMP